MQEFFTWAMLGTYAGALIATTLITQLIKEWGFVQKVPTRLTSYVVALVVLLAAAAFNDKLTVPDGLLCLFNAVVVSLAANGSFDALKNATTK